MVKGLLIGAVPVVMPLAGLTHLNLGQDQLTAVVDAIVGFVQALLTLVSVAATLYGLLRKLWITVFRPAQA